MIFDQHDVRQILAGRKTQMRRPVWPSETSQTKTHRFRVGTTIQCCRRATRLELREDPKATGIPIGEIIITAVTRGQLGDADLTAARAEGHTTLGEFWEYWEAAWPMSKVSLDLPVWVIDFVLDPVAAPRLLHRNSTRGYTTTTQHALAGEGEAIDDKLLEHYTQDAHDRFANQPGRREQQLRKRATALAKRLREDALGTMREGHDIAAELDAIERHLDILKGRRAA